MNSWVWFLFLDDCSCEYRAECGVLSSKHVLRNGTELILILMFQIMHFEKKTGLED